MGCDLARTAVTRNLVGTEFRKGPLSEVEPTIVKFSVVLNCLFAWQIN